MTLVSAFTRRLPLPPAVRKRLAGYRVRLSRMMQRLIDFPARLRFSRFVKGKRIAIVGPAWSVHGTGQGPALDSYDIVMRFNTAVPVKADAVPDIGSRTDILCNCLEPDPINGGPIQPQCWFDQGVRWVLSPYPRDLDIAQGNIRRFERLNKGLLHFIAMDGQRYACLQRLLQTRPNSGTLGILFLLGFPVHSLYVTGITFGRGGYHPGYKPGISAEQYELLANSAIHQQHPQEAFFRAVAAKDQRIQMDAVLSHIIRNGSIS